MSINDIISKYTVGEATLEDTNAALKEAGAGIHLDPQKNVLTEDERLATTVGWYPSQANGFGLLDSGTGTLDKVEVRNGQLVNCDMGESYALLTIEGKTYYVQGKNLTEDKPADQAGPVQADIDWRTRHPEAANGTLRQKTKKGVFDVHYNEIGQAVKATPVKFD